MSQVHLITTSQLPQLNAIVIEEISNLALSGQTYCDRGTVKGYSDQEREKIVRLSKKNARCIM